MHMQCKCRQSLPTFFLLHALRTTHPRYLIYYEHNVMDGVARWIGKRGMLYKFSVDPRYAIQCPTLVIANTIRYAIRSQRGNSKTPVIPFHVDCNRHGFVN